MWPLDLMAQVEIQLRSDIQTLQSEMVGLRVAAWTALIWAVVAMPLAIIAFVLLRQLKDRLTRLEAKLEEIQQRLPPQ